MGEADELTKAVLDLRKEIEELKQVLSAIVEIVFEEGYEDDIMLNRDEFQKLVPRHQNLYN
ncbi:MAG: hypothetical protein KAT70_02840 [Thermoplasmata archaeon]|nr:hypothetical protein [Thermoplasmata archaeon]